MLCLGVHILLGQWFNQLSCQWVIFGSFQCNMPHRSLLKSRILKNNLSGDFIRHPLQKIPKVIIGGSCCDMNQSDTIGKIELIPSIVLSSDNTDCKNDIQLFPQLFDELSVHTDYH